MSRDGARGWILTLALMVVLTVGLVVAYLAAPFDPPPNERADTGTPGTVAKEHRIVALRTDGALVLLDARNGKLSEVVTPDPGGPVTDLETGADHESAYVVREGGTIELVRIETGEARGHAEGRIVTVGPIAFPQLARSIPRPSVEQLAYVSVDGAGVVVENIATGDTEVISDDPSGSLRGIDDLALSPFDNRLFGVANGGAALFRLDADRAQALGQAFVADAPHDVRRYLDITPFGDGVAAAVERSDGSVDVVQIDRRSLEPVRVLLKHDEHGSPVQSIDADTRAVTLLVTVEDGTLLRVEPDAEPEELATDIALAVW